MIGRQDELQKLIDSIAKGQHTLLTGDIGIGKSHLLRQACSQLDRAIYIKNLSPLKSGLLEILQALHKNDDLEVESVEVEYLTWEELHKKIKRFNIKELLGVIQKNLQGKEYTLFFDHLETATPSMTRRIEPLIESATVIGAANKLKGSLKKFWWSFERIEIPPLNKEESKQLFWSLINREAIHDAGLLEQIVLSQSNGNPLSILQLAEKVKREENLTPASIRSLKHEAGKRFVDITPIFFIVGALIIAARFVALGMNSTELYILAGVSGGFFMGLRYFLYRSMRKED